MYVLLHGFRCRWSRLHGLQSRKNRDGSVAGTIAGLFMPLGALTQFVGERLSVYCGVKPGVDGAH